MSFMSSGNVSFETVISSTSMIRVFSVIATIKLSKSFEMIDHFQSFSELKPIIYTSVP